MRWAIRTVPRCDVFGAGDASGTGLVAFASPAGYYAADMTWRAVDGPKDRTVQIVLDRGKPVRLRALRFSGVQSIPLDRVEKQVASLKSQALRKPLLRPSVLADDLDMPTSVVRARGFARNASRIPSAIPPIPST